MESNANRASSAIDIVKLCQYAKQFSGLDDEQIKLLQAIQPDVDPYLLDVTQHFYQRLQAIPKVNVFLEGRLNHLKQTHYDWLQTLFVTDFDTAYARQMYEVGTVHVKVGLPVEFMAGGMLIIQSEMFHVFSQVYAQDAVTMIQAIQAFNAASGFSLLIMEESFQASTLATELEHFLQITGISHSLFTNLAKAYNKPSSFIAST